MRDYKPYDCGKVINDKSQRVPNYIIRLRKRTVAVTSPNHNLPIMSRMERHVTLHMT